MRNKMKVLIYGHRGWIGQQVIQTLEARGDIQVALGRARVERIEDVEKELEIVRPSHVMSFIGRTHGKIGDQVYTTIDYLEQPGKNYENVRDNLFAPVGLALLCQRHGVHLTYLGTGCIFEYNERTGHPFGEEVNGFKEDDLPNFIGSSYSMVKGFTDQLMHLLESHVLNVRIRMPITAENHPRNFITKITTYEKICSIPNSMTVLPDLIPKMIEMAEKRMTGTINLVNPGLISHNEILEMYREIVDPEFSWKNFSLEEQGEILAAGRSNNFLDTSRLEGRFPEVKGIREAVRDVLLAMRDSNGGGA